MAPLKLPFTGKALPEFSEREGFAIPQEAKYHSYARTRSFNHPQAGEDYSVFREMHKKPLSDRWFIREVWKRPNGRKTSPEDTDAVLEAKKVPGKSDLSLPQALHVLSKFEKENLIMGFEPEDSQNNDELLSFHFEKVATDEKILLDQNGEPHPVVNGRTISEGVFNPDRIKAISAANENQKSMTVRPLTEFSLNEIFADQNGKVDINHGLDKIEHMRKEYKFLNQVERGFARLLIMQNLIGSKNIKSINYVRCRRFLTESLNDLSIKADSFIEQREGFTTGLKAEDIKELVKRFDLIGSIALARASYTELTQNKASDGFTKSRENFEYLRSKAIEAVRALGGEKAHLENLDNHIVNYDGPDIYKKPDISVHETQNPDEDSDEQARVKQKLASFVEWSNGYDLHLYHMPEGVLDYMLAIRQAREEIASAMDTQIINTKVSTSHLQHFPEKGIHLGQWRPETLTRTFNIFVSPEALCEITFTQAKKEILKMNPHTDLEDADFANEERILLRLKEGRYNGEWVIPPRELIDGRNRSGDFKQEDNLLRFFELGILNLENGYFWSSTWKGGKIYNLRLGDIKRVDLDPPDAHNLNTIPVRFEEAQDPEPAY